MNFIDPAIDRPGNEPMEGHSPDNMSETTIHNPDRFMMDLRQILAQGRKRIGLLIGAGAPVAVKVNSEGEPRACWTWMVNH